MAEHEPDLNSGAIRPVADEVLEADLEVSGEVPRDLSGILVRNGPNPFAGRFEGSGMLSWWSGPAMLHGLAFDDGRALWYRNRWVRTGHWERFRDPTLAEDPLRDQNTNVNVVTHSGQILALGEGSLPFAVTRELETIGPHTFGGALPGGMTAHPKIDPHTGELVLFRTDLAPPYLHYAVFDGRGERVATQAIELEGPAMMHDFAITERYTLFLDLGVVFDLSLLREGARMPLRWHDEKPCRLGVMARHGGPVTWLEIEPCFIQHVVNAYEDGSGLVLEAVRYPEFLRFDRSGGRFLPNPLGVLWRFAIDLEAGTVSEAQLGEQCIELPRIDERRSGRPTGMLYAVEQPSDREMRGLLKFDFERDRLVRYPVPPGDQNSEPVFVPRDGASPREDDGWLLVCVYRQASDTSDVVVLDAEDPGSGPVATVHLPRRIPAGFHGAWLPSGRASPLGPAP